MRTRIIFVFSGIVLAVVAWGLIAQAQARRSVWAGVYTAEQAARGKQQFQETCVLCHGTDLRGIQDANLLGDFSPRFPITGPDFMDRWREDTVYSLFRLVSGGMPPTASQWTVQLEDDAYVYLVAYLLEANGFPAGNRELALSEMKSIRIQEQNGPKELPSFSRVQVVGCLTQYLPGVWQLSEGSDPIRIRDLIDPTEEDVADAAYEPLGRYAYDLQNLGFLGPQFDALAHENRKMVARGILIRQPPMVRIDVRAMVPVADTCPN